MTKLVLTHKPGSIYDDLPEEYYHFPNGPYLKAIREAVGDWVIYYEPKGSGASRNGRQAYFATARIRRIEPDSELPNHSYALVEDYLDFTCDVTRLRSDGMHYERALHQPDGSTNAGLRQRAVRRLDEPDFNAIMSAGLIDAELMLRDEEGLEVPGFADEQVPYERPIVPQLLNRPLRDAAFRHAVLKAYDSACAFTDLKIINGRKRAEVDAAHIRPVGDNHRGSDSIRNGMALSKTIHWLFDRGIVAVSNDYEILESPGRLPEQLKPLFRDGGRIRLPDHRRDRPSPVHLTYHRNMFEDEYGRFQVLS